MTDNPGCLGWNKFPRGVWDESREDQTEDASDHLPNRLLGPFVQTVYILRSPPPPIWDTRLHDSSILRHDDREPLRALGSWSHSNSGFGWLILSLNKIAFWVHHESIIISYHELIIRDHGSIISYHKFIISIHLSCMYRILPVAWTST